MLRTGAMIMRVCRGAIITITNELNAKIMHVCRGVMFVLILNFTHTHTLPLFPTPRRWPSDNAFQYDPLLIGVG